MSADAVDVLTSLYALRSQAGVVRVHLERAHQLSKALRLAEIQRDVTALIEEEQKSDEGQSLSANALPGH